MNSSRTRQPTNATLRAPRYRLSPELDALRGGRFMVIDAWRTSADVAVDDPHVKVRDVEAGKAIPFVELRGRN